MLHIPSLPEYLGATHHNDFHVSNFLLPSKTCSCSFIYQEMES